MIMLQSLVGFDSGQHQLWFSSSWIQMCVLCHSSFLISSGSNRLKSQRELSHIYIVLKIFSNCIFIVSFLYQLVVHVGVSGMATTVTLEKCGRNHGYKGLDNSSFCPDSQCCIVGGPDCIDSVIDMESVCKRVAASGLGVAVSVSKDAGR